MANKALIRPTDTKSRVAELQQKTNQSETEAEPPRKRVKSKARGADVTKASLLAKHGLPADFVEYKVHDGGQSRSATYARKGKLGVQLGVHKQVASQFLAFLRKCQEWDPDVELDPDHPNRARCSRCLTWIALKDNRHIQRFREHRQRGCIEALQTDSSERTLFDFKLTTTLDPCKKAKPSAKRVMKTCPGITAAYDPRIADYLSACGSTGGGSRSVTALSKEKFGVPYRDLDEEQQAIIRSAQFHARTWRNDTTLNVMACFACGELACKGAFEVDAVELSSPTPCSSCMFIYSSHAFQNTIVRDWAAKAQDDNQTQKFTPNIFRNETQGKIFVRRRGLEKLFEEVCKFHRD